MYTSAETVGAWVFFTLRSRKVSWTSSPLWSRTCGKLLHERSKKFDRHEQLCRGVITHPTEVSTGHDKLKTPSPPTSWDVKPRACRTKWQRRVCDGPTVSTRCRARRENQAAHSACRCPEETIHSHGVALCESASYKQVLGAGGDITLQFPAGLAAAYDLAYPNCHLQFLAEQR